MSINEETKGDHEKSASIINISKQEIRTVEIDILNQKEQRSIPDIFTSEKAKQEHKENIPPVSKQLPIIIDDNSPDPNIWLDIEDPEDPDAHFILYQDARANILKKTTWLCDSEIHAGQLLLKSKFPLVDGLHNPSISGELVTLPKVNLYKS